MQKFARPKAPRMQIVVGHGSKHIEIRVNFAKFIRPTDHADKCAPETMEPKNGRIGSRVAYWPETESIEHR